MSVLLRHPATVPALFSRAVDPESPAERGSLRWRGLSTGSPLLWAGVVLLDIAPVKAAVAALGHALPH